MGIEKSIKSVAEYIAQQESDPYLRIKALHDYVISRVTYDVNVLKTGLRPAQDAQTVFSTRKAVCEGYANLFMALGRAIGVDVVFIGGKVRRDLAPVDLIPTTLRLLNSNYDWTLYEVDFALWIIAPRTKITVPSTLRKIVSGIFP